MLPYAPDAIEALVVEVDPAVHNSIAERGCWSTWCKIEYVERDYDEQIVLAPYVQDAVRKYAACHISLAEPVLKTRDGWAEYVTRMEE